MKWMKSSSSVNANTSHVRWNECVFDRQSAREPILIGEMDDEDI